MRLHALTLATGLLMAGGAHATVPLALSGPGATYNLGAFSAPTTWGETFSVIPGTFNHSLTFSITTPLYAGSGVSDIPLSIPFGSITLDITDITSLSAVIYDSSNSLYATFVPNVNPDYLALPGSSYFAVGNYTLKVGGISGGTNGGFYTVAAVTIPVPEPETWAMLLAGLGLVGLKLRRKAAALV